MTGCTAPDAQDGVSVQNEQEGIQPDEAEITAREPAKEEPAAEAEEESLLAGFHGYDTEGNEITADIFSGKKLTMLNLWTTWCGYCIEEMPYLAELNREYADEGFQIVGVPLDVTRDSESMLEVMNSILSETGADYLQVMTDGETFDLLSSAASAVPTTLFIDENGNLVYDPISGAGTKEQWEIIIAEMLAMVQ